MSAGITPEEYATRNKPDVLAEYPLKNYGDNPTLAQIRVTSDWFVCMGYRVMDQQAATNTSPVYGYEFVYQRPPFYYPQLPNKNDPTGFFQPLAAHTSDIQFVFPGFHGGHLGVNVDQASGKPRALEGKEIDLSNQIVAAWTKFAETGNPNGTGDPPGRSSRRPSGR